jgi:hypothetical protein
MRAVQPNLNARIHSLDSVVPESEPLAERQLQHVTWHEPPAFSTGGRTAWEVLPDALPVPGILERVEALKLKGVGDSSRGRPVPPPLTRYSHKRSHFGIGDDGSFQMVWPERAPQGGLFLDRAQLEFGNARLLHDAGCPSILPIALFEYEDLRCEWAPHRPLGAVLTASASADSSRGDILFSSPDDKDDIKARSYRSLRDSLGRSRIAAIEALAYHYGRTLRQFHSSGLFRHNANPENVPYSARIERVFLTDLDSSRPLATCSERRRPLEILRDVAGAIYNFAAAFVAERHIAQFSRTELEGTVALRQLACGYFAIDCDGDVPSKAFDQVQDHLIAVYDEVSSATEMDQQERSSAIPRLSQGLVFPAAMETLVPLYLNTSLSQAHPLGVDTASLFRELRAFGARIHAEESNAS